jgi:alpha-mannosidase
MAPAHVTLVAHTHWDREWYEPFEVFRTQLLAMLDDALARLERDPRLHFTLDGQMAMVDDYLELRPDAAPRIAKLVKEKRLHVGPWFTAADTLLTDGEALLRNLCAGIRRGDALGGAMRLGYMPDQFGHAAQLPQLLRMVGIDSAAIWRGVGCERPPHAFRWIGPDGSAVTALWLQDGYASGRRLPSDPAGFADAVGRTIDRLAPWLGEMPLLVPVGDDHVRIADWLPDAAEALRARFPELAVTLGAYPDHLDRLQGTSSIGHDVAGELRSPAFAPVLAGVASARIPDKQAQAHATTMMLRYVEPLAAWGALFANAAMQHALPLTERAWRHLLHNQAHDSAAGCGSDATADDVRARSRWAEQLGRAARDPLLSALPIARPDGERAWIGFHPGPAAPQMQVEIEVPRALPLPLCAIGPDGIARPVQSLESDALEAPPLFEGELAASELSQYLGGLDPATPLFGRYLTGIALAPDGERRFRLDVGLGDTPIAPARLAADQRKVAALLDEADRFKIVVHGAGSMRRMLATVGPAGTAALVPFAVRKGEASDRSVVSVEEGALPAMVSGNLRVTVEESGIVTISDKRHPDRIVRANDLVDDGDRGDLYHFDPVDAAPIRPRLVGVEVVERGPARARLKVRQVIDLPVALTASRKARAPIARATEIETEVTVSAGERRVEFRVSLDNEARDHRLRALAHLPFEARRLDVEHCLAVIERPLDPSTLGAGIERAAPTGQHHLFADATDGKTGVALLSRGLFEHELTRGEGSATLALTLLRCVGWLARGDLACVDHAAGPMVPTPGAQLLGRQQLDYALLLHDGDWQRGDVHADAERYQAPPIALPLVPRSDGKSFPGGALVDLAPRAVVLSAAHPGERGGLVLRVRNASPDPVRATLRFPFPVEELIPIDPLERPLAAPPPVRDGASFALPLGPWQLATLRVRSAR